MAARKKPGCRTKDISGLRSFKLVAVSHSHTDHNGQSVWDCICDCGGRAKATANSISRQQRKSCGCDRRAKFPPEYSVWKGMIQRCLVSSHKFYKNYGGRGILICERWMSFELFFLDMGSRPHAKSQLDRIDNNGDYRPGNCRWASTHDQNRNKRTNRIIEFSGKTMCVADWAVELGLRPTLINQRLSRGWSEHRALSKSPRSKRQLEKPK